METGLTCEMCQEDHAYTYLDMLHYALRLCAAKTTRTSLV